MSTFLGLIAHQRPQFMQGLMNKIVKDWPQKGRSNKIRRIKIERNNGSKKAGAIRRLACLLFLESSEGHEECSKAGPSNTKTPEPSKNDQSEYVASQVVSNGVVDSPSSNLIFYFKFS